MKFLKFNKGFTLIELLVVVAIIGILSGVVLTSVRTARDKAKIARIAKSMQSLIAESELERTTQGYYPADLCTSLESGRFGKIIESFRQDLGNPGPWGGTQTRCDTQDIDGNWVYYSYQYGQNVPLVKPSGYESKLIKRWRVWAPLKNLRVNIGMQSGIGDRLQCTNSTGFTGRVPNFPGGIGCQSIGSGPCWDKSTRCTSTQ